MKKVRRLLTLFLTVAMVLGTNSLSNAATKSIISSDNLQKFNLKTVYQNVRTNGNMLFDITLGEENTKVLSSSTSGEGTFSVLSYNVAGLPEILSSSDPETNTVLISPFLNDYDLVSVQEDFAYHDDLISKVTLPYLTSHSGNVPFGDGMNFMSNFSLNNTTRVKWNDAYGTIDNGSDELTPKGILYSSIEIEDGYYIDVYDIHTDAGSDSGSYAARCSNMLQLADMINTYSVGKAVIVLGDTNSRYTRTEDNFEIAVLDACGLSDPWIDLIRGGDIPEDGDALMDSTNLNSATNEVVDKIWYRSGRNVELAANSYALLTNFVDSSGNQLSDHYPITATFSYETNEEIKTSELYGGDGGTAFSFLETMGNQLPDKISIQTGTRVDNISFTYPDGTTVSTGGTGGTLNALELAEGEYITSIQVSKAKKSLLSSYRISYIKFTTNLGHTLEGGTSGSLYTFTAPDGYGISGLYGFSGDEIDSLGAIYMLLP